MTRRTTPLRSGAPATRRRAVRGHLPRAVRLGASLVLGGLVAAPVLHVMGCGARSELEAPGGAELGCTETFSAVYSASIGGGIHHLFTECIPRPDGGTCPAAEDAMTEIQPVNCPWVDEVECGPIVKPEQCCYVVQETCGVT